VPQVRIYGHFAKECKTKPKEEKQEAAHHVASDIKTGALLVAEVCSVVKAGAPSMFLS
jgi:hypothetical protein